MTEEEKKQIIKMKDNGYSYYEISKELGLTQDAIRNYIYRENKKKKEVVDTTATLIKEIERLKKKFKKQRIQQIIDFEFADHISVPTYTVPKYEEKDFREEAVFLLSDVHYGMLHNGGTNIYTPEIAEERLSKTVFNANDILKKYHPNVKKLHIFLLGDMVEGNGIFKGQEYSSIPITDQIANFPSILASNLKQFELPFDIYAVRGNHGRIESGVVQHNWDDVIYKMVANMLPDIKVTIASDFYLPVKIKNTTFVLLHGDGITRSKVPSSLIERAVGEFTRMLKDYVNFDWMVMGHYHSARMLRYAILNGSLCGDTLFTTQKLHFNEEPQQVLFLVDDEWGVTLDRRIKCTE